MNYTELIEYFKSLLISIKWQKAEATIGFSESNSYGCSSLKYTNDNITSIIALDNFEVSPLLRKIFNEYLYGEKKRDFSEVILTITSSDYTVEYKMDDEKIKKEKAANARFFPNYIYEGMRSQIFDFEKENNLLTPVYTEDGDLDYYEDSWDTALFTFIIVNGKLIYNIELFKNDTKRILDIPLKETFKNEIFQHHRVTHNLLKNEWYPWNKMVVKGPKTIIPVGEEQDYVEYSLIDNV